MKRFIGLCALAALCAGVATQEADARGRRSGGGLGFGFGIGFGFEFSGGGGGHHGHGGHGHHGQQYLYIFPEGYQVYGQWHPHDGGQFQEPAPREQRDQKPFPPPPRREKGKPGESYQPREIINYPNLGYSIYQPANGYGHPYYAPGLRFDQ